MSLALAWPSAGDGSGARRAYVADAVATATTTDMKTYVGSVYTCQTMTNTPAAARAHTATSASRRGVRASRRSLWFATVIAGDVARGWNHEADARRPQASSPSACLSALACTRHAGEHGEVSARPRGVQTDDHHGCLRRQVISRAGIGCSELRADAGGGAVCRP